MFPSGNSKRSLDNPANMASLTMSCLPSSGCLLLKPEKDTIQQKVRMRNSTA
jgi:hypothetical protein